jgi:hypothetical protein
VLAGVGVPVDPQRPAARRSSSPPGTGWCAFIEAVVELDLEVVAVVDPDAAVDQVFCEAGERGLAPWVETITTMSQPVAVK